MISPFLHTQNHPALVLQRVPTRTQTTHPSVLTPFIKDAVDVACFTSTDTAQKASLPAATADKKKLVVLDYNGTASSDLPNIKTLFIKRRPSLIIMINTGRSLGYIKENKDKLKGIPIDYLCTYDGTELYHNEANQPFQEWIDQLGAHTQIEKWQKKLEKATNWSVATVRGIIDNVIKSILKEYQDQGVTLKTKTDADPKCYLSAPREISDKVEKDLKSDIFKQLRALKIRSRLEMEETKQSDTNMKSQKYAFLPSGYNKVKAIEFVMKHEPEISSLITAGNDINDLPMLKPDTISQKPNHSLICGEKEILQKELHGASHCEFLHNKPLSKGIEDILNAI